jgi:hypothetical protein
MTNNNEAISLYPAITAARRNMCNPKSADGARWNSFEADYELARASQPFSTLLAKVQISDRQSACVRDLPRANFRNR